jgi:hypothetical protein
MVQTYFIFDRAQHAIDSISAGDFPSYLIYGGYHLKQQGLAEITDSKKIKNSQVVINVPKYAPSLKAQGNRVILINLNSNHILQRNPGKILSWALRKIYNSCDVIMCLDKSQIKPLRKLGITSKIIVNPLFVDTTDIERAQVQLKYGFKTYSPYYLSAGFDDGRSFRLSSQVDSIIPIFTLGRHNPVPYIRYCKILAASSGMILEINNSADSSDLSGSTTVFESLCAHKPVFINEQYWLKNFPSKNIYIYKTKEELEELLNKKIEWIQEPADFTFGQYLKKIKKILKIK